MDCSFLTRPIGLWLLTVFVTLLLMGLGYELADHFLEPQVQEIRQQLADEASRANLLAAENQRLEARLTQAEAQLGGRPGPPPPRFDPELVAEPEPGGSRQLRRGEAAELLEGRVVLVLEGFSKDRRQAQILVRVLGGQETTASLTIGSDLTIHLPDRSYRLVLRKIMANSIVYTLRPLEENPGPPRRGR
jgi:hypothetical protein